MALRPAGRPSAASRWRSSEPAGGSAVGRSVGH